MRPGKPLRVWIVALGPVVLYGLAIYLVSAQSNLPPSPVGDKIAHFAEYALLGFLLTRGLFLLFDRGIRWAAVVAVVASTAFGLTDELHQYFVPNRDASLLDLVADFAGSVAGAVAYGVLAREIRARLATPGAGGRPVDPGGG